MKIAIAGAGFAGLGTAFYLLHHSKGSVLIDLFDPYPIGGSVSGLSAGLLHAFPGRRGEKIEMGDLLLQSTHDLIGKAAQGFGKPLVISRGILRPAINEDLILAFQKCSEKYRETEWWSKEKCLEKIPSLSLSDNSGGLYIKEGITLDVKGYLEGLWQMCLRFGLQYHQRALLEEDFANYDKIVLASGTHVKGFKPLSHLHISAVKGQILHLKWPSSIPPLPYSLIAEGFVVMERSYKSCLVGATFERDYIDEKPDQKKALSLIMEKITPFLPALKEAPILDCQAGIRAIAKDSIPLVGKVLDKYWYLTGLGAKGLLYHAYLGDLLAQAILADDPSLLPILT